MQNSNVALVEANSVDAAPPASPASESSCGDPDASSGHYGDDDGAHNTATLLISDKKTNGGGALRKKVRHIWVDIQLVVFFLTILYERMENITNN